MYWIPISTSKNRRFPFSALQKLAISTFRQTGKPLPNCQGFFLFQKKSSKKREHTYVEDCFCGFCYTCGCFFSSYLDSPSRRLWHNARFYCSELVEHRIFEAVILFLITFSSITLVRYLWWTQMLSCSLLYVWWRGRLQRFRFLASIFEFWGSIYEKLNVLRWYYSSV